MKSLHHRLWLAAIIMVLSIGGLVFSAWPVSREQVVIALPAFGNPPAEETANRQEAPAPGSSEQTQIVIEAPAYLRVGDDDWIWISLAVQEDAAAQPAVAAGETWYADHNLVAVARLEMPELGAWPQDLREPVRPGRPVRFRWALRANRAGVSRGVLWVSIEFVPKAGGDVQKTILLSRPVVVQAVSPLGLPARVVRWAGGVGLAGSFLYLLMVRWVSRGPVARPQSPPKRSELP